MDRVKHMNGKGRLTPPSLWAKNSQGLLGHFFIWKTHLTDGLHSLLVEYSELKHIFGENIRAKIKMKCYRLNNFQE